MRTPLEAKIEEFVALVEPCIEGCEYGDYEVGFWEEEFREVRDLEVSIRAEAERRGYARHLSKPSWGSYCCHGNGPIEFSRTEKCT
ncbi:MAG: hypothetical protein MK171_06240 [Pirellulales bacterium]|nr:hypothetical protein [Pirellulales bacterium]